MHKKLILILLALSVLLTPLSQAEESDSAGLEGKTVVESDSHANSADSEVVNQAVQESSILIQLKQQLASAQYRFSLLQTNVERAKEDLMTLQGAMREVKEKIEEIEADIKDKEHQILSVKTQDERQKMELEDLEEQATMLELQLDDQKALVGRLTTLLYVKQNTFYQADNINAVKVLASDRSVSETLQDMTYLELIEAKNQEEMAKMEGLSDAVAAAWKAVRIKREELANLDEKLAADLEVLKMELAIQEALLQEMEGDETIFLAMIESADEREEDLVREIEIYKNNVAQMEAQMNGTRLLLSEDQQALIDTIQSELEAQFDPEEAATFLDLDWPVSPDRGLTAFFHDSGYVSRFGVDHWALDIRANHGTSIFAPADGVVYKIIHDSDSNSYAYVMLAHRMGVMTLYGHVSEVAVQSGDFVQRGQIIGLTGGTPGTVGAGQRTTGPHLHMEVWQDGARVDPLLYLPLEEVPEDSLPDQYRAKLQEQLENQIKSLQETLGF